MKHPTASADLAGKTWQPIEREPDRFIAFESLDGDALAGSNMAREMARAVKLGATYPQEAVPDCGCDMAEQLARGTYWVDHTGHARCVHGYLIFNFCKLCEPSKSPDPRKPWTEPTVTECATTNRRPATLTIAGADLPKPEGVDASVITPAIKDGLLTTLAEMERWLGGQDGWGNTDWHAGPKGLDGKAYAFHIRAAIAEIQRQAAEITELQGMLEEAIGPVRLVSELATMTDTECDFMDAGDLRLRARGQLDGDFTMPRMYDGEDRKRAVEAVLADRPKTNPLLAMEVVDIVAEALGLRRAS